MKEYCTQINICRGTMQILANQRHPLHHVPEEKRIKSEYPVKMKTIGIASDYLLPFIWGAQFRPPVCSD
jgi:hypothetical protein